VEFLKIVAFSVGAAIAYGIIHDQVTAHLCVEYFTIAHPPVFPTQSPFWLAVGWGIIATWWVGLPLGIVLAIVARAGPRPPLSLKDVRPLIFQLLIAMALTALVAGILGAVLAASGRLQLPEELAQLIPSSKHVAFMADAWAHRASYASGVIGGLIVIGFTLWRRMAGRIPIAG